MSIRLICMILCCALSTALVGDEPAPTRCELIPLPEHQVSFQIDGVERIRWHFGGGKLTSSEGQKGEANIFGKRSRWVDYSGPVAVGRASTRKTVIEGITYFDHPDNPRYPTCWHVREDGWMEASFCMREGFVVARVQPLTLRYLLSAHSGSYNGASAEAEHAAFAARPEFEVTKSTQPHNQYTVQRKKS